LPELVQLPSGRPLEYEKPLNRAELEQWAQPLIRRIEAPIREALRRCGRKRSDIEEVLLVGGMTRMPAVQREIARVTGREPEVIPNPEEVVAVGAALEVARLEGTIEGVLLIDVAARGLAVSMGGDCEQVIAQSSVVPTREHRVFATRHDDQLRIEFDVWEGESPDPADNRHLGRYAVLDLPPAPAGDVLVLVEMTIDTDGTVRFGASELVSGERLQLEQLFHAGLARTEVSRLQRQLED
jgi:molecular chaperone DnaK